MCLLFVCGACTNAKKEEAETPSAGESSTAPLVIYLTVPADTPSDDLVYLKVYGPTAYQMTRLSATRFKLEMEEVTPGETLYYSYSRNNVGFQAAELVSPERTGANWDLYREILIGDSQQIIEDAVVDWRWLFPDGDIPAPPANLAASTTFVARVNSEEFMTGVGMHDYWSSEFLQLTARAAAYNVSKNMKWVLLFPNGKYNDDLQIPFVIDREPSGQYDEASLREQIQIFKSGGMKVALSVGIINDGGVSAAQSNAYWDSRFQAYQDYIVWMAGIAEEEGVEAIFIMSHAILPGGDYPPNNGVARWQTLMSAIRSAYSGKVGYNLHWNRDFDELHPFTRFSSIVTEFDYVGGIMWDSLGDQDAPTDSELRTEVARQFDEFLEPIWTTYGVPTVITQVAYSSAAMGHKGERLYPADDVSIGTWEPYDDSVPFDFTLQAQIYDSILYNIASRPYIVGTYVFGQPYWKSQDKNMGVWGKPAADTISDWYQKASP